jgi:dTMP kinase
MVSYWESGRDLNLSNDLFDSFVLYQTALRRELASFAREHDFIEVDSDSSVATVNKVLRRRIAHYLGIKSTAFKPSGQSKDLLK